MTEYEEAVQNIAYHLMRLAKRDFDPLAENYDDNQEFVLEEFVETNEHIEEWVQLEEIALLTCATHNIDYSTLMDDVWDIMIRSLDYRDETIH